MLTTRKKNTKPRNKNNKPDNVWKNTVSMGRGFPKKVRMTHRYHETITVTGPVGAIGIGRFACNGMYDPNLSGVGHQPYYFDQMAAIYNHYTVTKSSIVLHVTAAYAASSMPAYIITLSQNDDTTQTASTIDATVEMSSGTREIVPVNTTTKVPRLYNSWNATNTFGGDPLSNDNLQGSIGSNPIELTTWSICLQSLDTVTSVSVFVEALIEYDAVWDEIKDIASS